MTKYKVYLLDTNIFFKYLVEPQNLSENLKDILKNPANELFVSTVVPWEIASKHAKGKLPKGGSLLASYDSSLVRLGMKELAITGKHAIQAGQLPAIHQDPFDRLIIAQVQVEALTVITLDSIFKSYSVSVFTE